MRSYQPSPCPPSNLKEPPSLKKSKRTDLRLSQPIIGLKPCSIQSPSSLWLPKTPSNHRPLLSRSNRSITSSSPSGQDQVFLTPHQALTHYKKLLSEWERQELFTYPEIYYFDLIFKKTPEFCTQKHAHVAFRYELIGSLGQGSFAKVFQAVDHKKKRRVALKVVRPEPSFTKTALREVEFLKAMARFYGTANYSAELLHHFSFRGHRVLVFEQYSATLRSILSSESLQLAEIVKISQQIVHGLSQLHAKGIIHSDLKPDNLMFLSKDNRKIKIIDLGSAASEKKLLYKLVQSRYYRAPEVILGYAYTRAIDMWSIGCIAAELVTGKPLFEGKDEWDQLGCFAEYLGKPPAYLIEKAPRKEDLGEHNLSREPNSKRFEDIVQHPVLLKLLQGCLTWDPALRVSAQQCIKQALFA